MKHIIHLIVATLALSPSVVFAQTKIERTPFGTGVYDKGTSKWIIQNRFDKIKTIFDAVSNDVYYACQKGIFAVRNDDPRKTDIPT